MAKSLVAFGAFARVFESEDKWTDKATGEQVQRPYKAALIEFLGGRHVVRAPFENGEANAAGLESAFSAIKAGDSVEVDVRLNGMGRLELAPGAGTVRKAS